MSLQASVIRQIFLSASSMGTAYDELCRLTNVSPEEISTSEKMVEWEKAALIWEPLQQLTNDPLIGLHLGMELSGKANSMVGFLMQSSSNLSQAYQVFCTYSNTVAPMVDFKYHMGDTHGIVHPLISHGLGGEHGVDLSTFQLFTHTVALIIFGAWFCRSRNKSLQILFPQVANWAGLWPLVIGAPVAFWAGYYAFYIPFDILFMLMTVGAVTAVRLRPYVHRQNKWMWQCIISYTTGAVAGIVMGLVAFKLNVLGLRFLVGEMVLWAAISAPAGIVAGLMTGGFLKRHWKHSEQMPQPNTVNSLLTIKTEYSKELV